MHRPVYHCGVGMARRRPGIRHPRRSWRDIRWASGRSLDPLRAPRDTGAVPVKPASMRLPGIGLGPLVAVMYFTVSGGPYGLEGLVGLVGPGVTLVLLVGTPLIYSLPEALLVGELASMLPAEGGYYVWVRRAFGRFFGFWNGWLSWVYSLVDMAIYPVLMIQYLRFFVPDLPALGGSLVSLAMIWGSTWMNLRGTRVVGAASGGFVLAVLAPVAVLAVVALARWITGSPVAPLPISPFHAAGTSFAGALGI